jgi:hypothetical protein
MTGCYSTIFLAKCPPPIIQNSAVCGVGSHELQSKTLKARKRTAKFLLFIDSLIKYLKVYASPEHVRLTKSIILECTKRNRIDPQGIPLSGTILFRIKESIGTMHWENAHMYFCMYMEDKKGVRVQKLRLRQQQLLLQQQQRSDWKIPFQTFTTTMLPLPQLPEVNAFTEPSATAELSTLDKIIMGLDAVHGV